MMYHKVFANSIKTKFIYIINNYIIKTADIDKNKSQTVKIYKLFEMQIFQKKVMWYFL